MKVGGTSTPGAGTAPTAERDSPPGPFRCGFAALVGRPNVGKSTLLNRILGQKLSITARRPQTTRHRILGIKTGAAFQAIYVDTPGLHTGRGSALNRYMNRTTEAVLADLDVGVLVVEALRWTERDSYVLAQMAARRAPLILAINKIDRLKHREELLPFMAACGERTEFAAIVPVSARRGENVAELEREVVACLPAGEALFPPAQLTDRDERFLAAELIREKLTRLLGEELPYRLTVTIERFVERSRLVEIGAVIWVEQAGQKAIVIGHEGSVLKQVGSQARRDLETALGRKVMLDLWVRIRRGWSDDERALRQLGYHDAD